MKNKVYTPEEIGKKFDALPQDIKTIVYGADMTSVLEEVGNKYQLHIDQLSVVEAETADIMTGYSEPEDFAKNLAVELSIEQSKAELIAKDINDQLFVKIRESLKKLYEKPGGGAIVNPPYTPPAAPVASAAPAPVPVVVQPSVAEPANKLPVAAKPILPMEMHEVLEKPVVSAAPSAPKTTTSPTAPQTEPAATPSASATPTKNEVPAPAPYKTDPYREIPE